VIPTRLPPSKVHNNLMRVMGVDPGISHTGYGIVESSTRGALVHVASGGIVTSSQMPFVQRLQRIYGELEDSIKRYSPDSLAIEEVFFAKNPRAALLLGHARGVILLCAGMSGIPVYEYSATAIKTALCRFGRASKEQVTSMVKVLLHLDRSLPTHDADALAACICHIHTQGTSHRVHGTRSASSRQADSRRVSHSLSREE